MIKAFTSLIIASILSFHNVVVNGNLKMIGNTISSEDTNGNIILDTNGAGEITMNNNIRLTDVSFTCDSTKRGVMYFEEHAIDDKVYVCMLSSSV